MPYYAMVYDVRLIGVIPMPEQVILDAATIAKCPPNVECHILLNYMFPPSCTANILVLSGGWLEQYTFSYPEIWDEINILRVKNAL